MNRLDGRQLSYNSPVSVPAPPFWSPCVPELAVSDTSPSPVRSADALSAPPPASVAIDLAPYFDLLETVVGHPVDTGRPRQPPPPPTSHPAPRDPEPAAARVRLEELREIVESADARIGKLRGELSHLKQSSQRGVVRWVATSVAVAAAALVVARGLRNERQPRPTLSATPPEVGYPVPAPGVGTLVTKPTIGDSVDAERPLSTVEPAAPARPAVQTKVRGHAGLRQGEPPAPAIVATSESDVPLPVGTTFAATPPNATTRPARIDSAFAASVPDSSAPAPVAAVEVTVTVDASGRVVKAEAAAPDPALSRAAEAAALRWQFQPALVDGVAVESQLRVSVPLESRDAIGRAP